MRQGRKSNHSGKQSLPHHHQTTTMPPLHYYCLGGGDCRTCHQLPLLHALHAREERRKRLRAGLHPPPLQEKRGSLGRGRLSERHISAQHLYHFPYQGTDCLYPCMEETLPGRLPCSFSAFLLFNMPILDWDSGLGDRRRPCCFPTAIPAPGDRSSPPLQRKAVGEFSLPFLPLPTPSSGDTCHPSLLGLEMGQWETCMHCLLSLPVPSFSFSLSLPHQKACTCMAAHAGLLHACHLVCLVWDWDRGRQGEEQGQNNSLNGRHFLRAFSLKSVAA